MFIRNKSNKTGKISVQIIEKVAGKNKVLQTIGCSAHEHILSQLLVDAKNWIKTKSGAYELD